MSSIANRDKTLLVTGITGYIGAALGETILANGYHLRGTTRSAASAKIFLAGPYAPYLDRVQIIEVPDIAQDGAFDHAVKGVHGIFHVACPMGIDFENPWHDMVMPAVRSTRSILESAFKHADSQLSAMVFTSSISTMMDGMVPENKIYTESDSGDAMVEVSKHMNPDHPLYPYRGFAAYMAAKKMSLDAVWSFRDTYQPKFAITTLHPVSIIGRPAYVPSKLESLSPSFQPIVSIWQGPADAAMPPQLAQGAFVDVWDVAKAHLWAYENYETANSQQYILSAGVGPPQARADIMRERFPSLGKRCIKGEPGEGYAEGVDYNGRKTRYWYKPGTAQVSGEKFVEAAEYVYKSLEQSVLESVEALEKTYAD